MRQQHAYTVPHHQAGCYSQILCLYIDIKYHTCCSSRLLYTGWFYFIGIEKDPSPCISSNWLAATVHMRMSVDDVSAGTWWCSIMQICMHEETPSLPSQFMQLSELSSSEMLVATHARINLALQVQSAIDRVFYQSSTLSAEKCNGTLHSSIAIVYYPRGLYLARGHLRSMGWCSCSHLAIWLAPGTFLTNVDYSINGDDTVHFVKWLYLLV